jgi:hypothetical protein
MMESKQASGNKNKNFNANLIRGGAFMDFMTGMGYWGIILLAIINAIIVSRMKIVFHGEEEDDEEKRGSCSVG